MRDAWRKTIGAGALFVWAAAAGCEEGGPGEIPGTAERSGTVDLTIGRLDGPEEYTFGGVTGLAADGRGRVYVLDGQAGTVRVYGPDGAHRFDVGRPGQGPGELSEACCLAVSDDGVLWVRNGGNLRYDAFRLLGDSSAYEGTRRMRHGAGTLWAPLHVQGDTLLDLGGDVDDDGRAVRLRYLVGPRDGSRELPAVSEPTLEEIGGGRAVTYRAGDATGLRWFYVPFGPRYLIAFGPGGAWAEAVSSERRVVLHTAVGDSVAIDGPAGPGPELSQAERDRARESIDRSRRFAGAQADLVDWSVPDRKPLLRELYFDVLGRLWVERSVPDGEPRRADLYDGRGALVERRAWPGDVSLSVPAWVGRDRALGVATDSLGVQRVVRVAW